MTKKKTPVVQEVSTVPAKPGRFKTRGGDIAYIGFKLPVESTAYPWVGYMEHQPGDTQEWMDNGRFYGSEEDSWDLVEEITQEYIYANIILPKSVAKAHEDCDSVYYYDNAKDMFAATESVWGPDLYTKITYTNGKVTNIELVEKE